MYEINAVMPPKPRFSRDHLRAAALAIVDAEGAGALSMRRLAETLGTGAMTLYTYVRDREALDALVVEAAIRGTSWPTPTADWRADVAALAEATWIAIRGHPKVAPLILAQRGRHEALLAPAEALLAALARGGRSGEALLGAFRAVHGYIFGFAQIRLAGADDPAVAQVQALPPERFPRLAEAAHAAAATNLDAEFRLGLAVILAGL
jgi:AcrR family transcriptional regulator